MLTLDAETRFGRGELALDAERLEPALGREPARFGRGAPALDTEQLAWTRSGSLWTRSGCFGRGAARFGRGAARFGRGAAHFWTRALAFEDGLKIHLITSAYFSEVLISIVRKSLP